MNEYIEIEELDFNAQDDEQTQADEIIQNQFQSEFLPVQPNGFNAEHDDAMLRKLLNKFQMLFLFPILKASDVTYRSLKYLSVEDINTVIRSVGHRAEFREKLFSWRRKRYRTNDILIEYEKVIPTNCLNKGQSTDSETNSMCTANIKTTEPSSSNFPSCSTTNTQNAMVVPEIDESPSTEPNAMISSQNSIKPLRNNIDSSLLEIITELPPEIDYEMEPIRAKLYCSTVEIRETRLNTQLNLVNLLEESLFGPVMKAFYKRNGYLERKHRDELIECIVDYVISHDIKLHSSDFKKIVDMVINLFPSEEESRDYYFINRKGKRNPMGRLYTKYYNTLKRRRVRESAPLQAVAQQDDTTSTSITQTSTMMCATNTLTSSSSALGGSKNRCSSDGSNDNSKTITTQIELVEDEFGELMQLDDTSVSRAKNVLRSQKLEWSDIKTLWSKTYLKRQEDVKHSTTENLLQQWPSYLSSRGMELFDIDFRLKFSRDRGDALHQKWQKFANKICNYYQGNIKDDMCKGLFALYKSKPGKDTEDYILTVLLNAIMLPMARYHDAFGNRRKISIAEAVDLFSIRVNAIKDFQHKREEFSIKYGDIHTDYTPLIVVVSDASSKIHENYVHFDDTFYEMPDFISAIDCCMKIYRVLNLPYPSSNAYSWTFIQRHFYEIMFADDKNCPSMSSLITYLKF